MPSRRPYTLCISVHRFEFPFFPSLNKKLFLEMRKIQNHKYFEILKILNVYEFGHTFEGVTRSAMAINNPEIKVNIKILKHLMFINFY
jgi:hypothetical protein